MTRRFLLLFLACTLCAAAQEDEGTDAAPMPSLKELIEESNAATQVPETDVEPEPEPASWDDFQALYVEDMKTTTTSADQREGEGNAGATVGTTEEGTNDPPAGPWDWSQADLLRYVATVLALCGAIIFLGYLLRRFGKHVPALAGPSLGKVLGTVYLAPKVALHYVHSGERILVIGVSPNGMNLITEFDAETFRGTETASSGEEESVSDATRFKNLLDERLAGGTGSPRKEPEDIRALRGDIERLQQTLREGVRGAGE